MGNTFRQAQCGVQAPNTAHRSGLIRGFRRRPRLSGCLLRMYTPAPEDVVASQLASMNHFSSVSGRSATTEPGSTNKLDPV